MLVGLVGASRSGKTTVMKAVAERLGIAYHATSTSKVMERLGIDLTAPLTLRDRLRVQIEVFDSFIDETAGISAPTILDRTPIDMMAYLLCEIGMASHEELGDDVAKVMRYVELCREHTTANFGALFALRPLPVYVEEAFKPNSNPAYHHHFQLLVEGALTSFGGAAIWAVIQSSDHEERVSTISSIVQHLIDTAAPQRVGTVQ